MRRFLALCLLICMLCIVCTACAPSTASEKIKIVTTIFPPYDFARVIAGERAECTMLMGVGAADTHGYEPTSQDFAALSDADLFLCIGGDGEAWVSDAADACGVGEVLHLLDLVETEHHDHEQEHDHGHAHSHTDEHVWTDPANVVPVVNGIADALCRIDPAGEAYYRANQTAYLAQLADLTEAYRTTLADAPQKTLVVADKFPFRYLANAYHLTYIAAFPGCAGDTEPSLRTIASLIETVEQEQTTVVLHLEFSNQKIADTVCESTGAKKRMLHSCHTLSAQDLASGETYLSLMRQNLEVLREALGI